MSRIKDIADLVIGLVRDADVEYDTGNADAYDDLENHVVHELASLIQDAIYDHTISNEAEAIMEKALTESTDGDL